MLFKTKAETLDELQKIVCLSKILPQIRFSVYEWENDRYKILNKLKNVVWGGDNLIIRSSSINEDTEKSSMAGKFLSILDVKGIDNISRAIEKIIEAFNDKNQNNQIFIQPMMKNIKLSGVAFTCNPNNGGNYYVINYDNSGSTSSITDGTSIDSKVFYWFKDSNLPENIYLNKLIKSIKEIEEIFNKKNLDIEFAVDTNDDVYIFQVRPLIINGTICELQNQKNILNRIENKINKMNQKNPGLHGNSLILGVMPDWNPAEIIGIHPRPLALSLYKEVITDNVWAYQRDNYGYLNLRSFPLLIDLAGIPYIDVRVSFNSFIPKGLDCDICEKLVNYYLKRFKEDPSKHDKVEFEIIFSCYTFDLPDRIQILKKYGFSEKEIEEIINSLKSLTHKIINPKNGLWKRDSDKIEILEKKRKEIIDSNLDYVSKIYWLLEYCKRYGTLPFAGLARAGFIAIQMLKSFVSMGIFNNKEYNEFMKSLKTVSTSLKSDLINMTKKGFLEKYGHLRPGTYDINSKRYDEDPDIYFDWRKVDKLNEDINRDSFKISLDQLKSIRKIMLKQGIDDDVLLYLDFIKESIEGREYSKFIFTRCISDILVLMEKIGKEYGLTKNDLSFINVNVIKKLYSSEMDEEEIMLNSIEEGKRRYFDSLKIVMPPVIFDTNDIYNFHMLDTEPNYITLKKIKGKVCLCCGSNRNIENSILLILSADPGYDWIFSHNIKGFITAYGGANSHMAIRAGELQIPAVIGVGEKIFEKLSNAQYLEIDSEKKKITVIK
ncbi:phosphoenolpyruvate synthase [Clostridium carnis]|uniref:Phosphoenolpyruvate synthase n=1 Tax=Clostridium carnis TaxID=1530 RepID=A0ABY6SVX4_9CLOT|nr:PEP/pyruvate-binding domain-containing protein [Clostridium carnis]VDG72433.1 phosphoenolpyruvate synthase [Clostridium carnis]